MHLSVSPPPAPAPGNSSPRTSDSTACRGCPSPLLRTRSMLTASTPGAPLLARTFSHASQHEALGDLKRLHLRLGSRPRLLPRRVGLGLTLVCPAPSLRPHYRTFTATTSRSAPVPRIGTLPLTVPPLGVLPLAAGRLNSPSTPAVAIGTTGSPVPCQRLRRAHATYTPDTARASTQAAPWLRARHPGRAFVPGTPDNPGFDAIVLSFDASAVVHTRSSSRRTPDPLTAGLFRNAHHPGS